MTTRRSFTFGIAGAAATGLIAPPSRATSAGAAPGLPAVAGTTARGELAERIHLTAERLTRGGRPAYTPDFILADVALDRRRRFWEFSGDLSGRYVEALSILPAPAGPELAPSGRDSRPSA